MLVDIHLPDDKRWLEKAQLLRTHKNTKKTVFFFLHKIAKGLLTFYWQRFFFIIVKLQEPKM